MINKHEIKINCNPAKKNIAAKLWLDDGVFDGGNVSELQTFLVSTKVSLRLRTQIRTMNGRLRLGLRL
jgi:hypothetical protein